jgi:hypothetical protein
MGAASGGHWLPVAAEGEMNWLFTSVGSVGGYGRLFNISIIQHSDGQVKKGEV